MQKIVSILGCGWVGEALKEALNPTHRVHCLSRNMQENEKMHKYTCHTLIIAIPPRENYLEVLRQTMQKITPTTQVIFLSSTSFYDGKELVVQGETLIKNLHSEVLILRLSGLMGYNRIAGRYSAGQTKAHDARVNYVHRDDAVAIIKLSIQREETSNTFDVTAPNHPKQSEVFSQNANKFGWEKTYFKSNEVLGKRVSSQKLMAHFNYRFLYPNPLEFW